MAKLPPNHLVLRVQPNGLACLYRPRTNQGIFFSHAELYVLKLILARSDVYRAPKAFKIEAYEYNAAPHEMARAVSASPDGRLYVQPLLPGIDD